MRVLTLLLSASMLLAFCCPRTEAEPKKSAAALLLADGDRLFASRDYAKATQVYEKAAEQAEAAEETSTLVEALSMVARGHLIRKQAAEGRPWLERAKKLASNEDPQGWSRYLGVRGRFEWKAEEKPRSAKTFRAMYGYCLEHELWSRAVDAAHMMAIVGTHEQQVTWARKGIAAAEKGQMDGWLGPLWNNLGNTYDELKQPQDALNAWWKARSYHWKVGNEKSKLVADWAVGLGYRKVGELQKAKQWQRPVLAWAERRLVEKDEPERREWVALAKMELGLIALAEKRTADAGALLLAAYPALHDAGMDGRHPAAWMELTAACSKSAPRALVKLQMDRMSNAVDHYQLENKKLPSTLDELAETSGRNPTPFLSSIPIDAWGNPYAYRTLDRRTYKLSSNGPDGLPETADDVVR